MNTFQQKWMFLIIKVYPLAFHGLPLIRASQFSSGPGYFCSVTSTVKGAQEESSTEETPLQGCL